MRVGRLRGGRLRGGGLHKAYPLNYLVITEAEVHAGRLTPLPLLPTLSGGCLWEARGACPLWLHYWAGSPSVSDPNSESPGRANAPSTDASLCSFLALREVDLDARIRAFKTGDPMVSSPGAIRR